MMEGMKPGRVRHYVTTRHIQTLRATKIPTVETFARPRVCECLVPYEHLEGALVFCGRCGRRMP